MQDRAFDREKRAEGLRCWTAKYGGLKRIQGVIQGVNGRHVVSGERIQQEIEEVIGAVLQLVLIRADVSPDPLHSIDGLGVMGDEIVTPKKNIELTRCELQRLGVEHHAMDYCKDVVAPVINLRNMDLAQGIVNGQGMKAK